jgi:hypothetical protein
VNQCGASAVVALAGFARMLDAAANKLDFNRPAAGGGSRLSQRRSIEVRSYAVVDSLTTANAAIFKSAREHSQLSTTAVTAALLESQRINLQVRLTHTAKPSPTSH